MDEKNNSGKDLNPKLLGYKRDSNHGINFFHLTIILKIYLNHSSLCGYSKKNLNFFSPLGAVSTYIKELGFFLC